MRTFHGVRLFNNIVHNAEPVDLHEPWAFLFQYTWLLDAYEVQTVRAARSSLLAPKQQATGK
jgi:hypothetical protein